MRSQVVDTIALDDVTVPIYPMLYGNPTVTPSGSAETINFGATPFHYDPATGSYVGPDGKVYTQANLASGAPTDQTWQSMLVPPGMP